MSWELIVKKSFSSAHFLENYKGKCENMHGHTFQAEVYFKVDKLDNSGIGIDFTEIKKYLDKILPDHKLLNDLYEFPPSAENISKYLYYKIKDKYPSIKKIIIWESENAGAVYSEDK